VKSLFTRYEGNPILTPEQWPYPANSVFNPGAAEFDGETLLLVRVEDLRGLSHLCVARSANGFSHSAALVSALPSRSATVTARLSGLSRLPSQIGHGWVLMNDSMRARI